MNNEIILLWHIQVWPLLPLWSSLCTVSPESILTLFISFFYTLRLICSTRILGSNLSPRSLVKIQLSSHMILRKIFSTTPKWRWLHSDLIRLMFQQLPRISECLLPHPLIYSVMSSHNSPPLLFSCFFSLFLCWICPGWFGVIPNVITCFDLMASLVHTHPSLHTVIEFAYLSY